MARDTPNSIAVKNMPLEIPLKAFFYSGRNNGVSET
jgi:hypothetical protein